MGEISEWISVLGRSAAYFCVGLLWETYKSKSFREFFETLPGWFLVALLWAMMAVFRWRVLHGGIALVFATLLVTMFTLVLALRRATRRRELLQ